MKTFRTTIAFIQALFTLIGFGVMAAFFYAMAVKLTEELKEISIPSFSPD
jgi:hypothetical protein